MNQPALTPEQWQKWRESKRFSFVHSIVAYVDEDGLFYAEALNTPAEYRATIAVLLDSLAQAGEPLFTHEDADVVFRLKAAAENPSDWWSDWWGGNTERERKVVQDRADTLAARIASLLPPQP